ncbi:MAG: hypothetical protein AAGG02_01350 [Cyanobacteria bacterium P01_H01_bin.15]
MTYRFLGQKYERVEGLSQEFYEGDIINFRFRGQPYEHRRLNAKPSPCHERRKYPGIDY